jgi:hypothetical protein
MDDWIGYEYYPFDYIFKDGEDEVSKSNTGLWLYV